ncbi:hypothetical protein QZH41_004105 [Actinostola sp. cb2023]|nr:hypothetical protein QZH41_004105 [Actinostola sp. cb2023]
MSTVRYQDSVKSVSFAAPSDDIFDSPTFPRWRAYSADQSSTESFVFSETSLQKASKDKEVRFTTRGKKGFGNYNRDYHLSFQNSVHLAALSGDEKEVKRLLARGACVNKFDHHGKTPLHNAILSRIASVVQVVLLAGADVNLPDHHGDMPIHIAVGIGSNDVVKLLLQCPGCQVNIHGQNGMTPLHLAAQLNYATIAVMLVAHDAIVDDKAGYFLTPFALAVSKGSYETSKYFLSIVTTTHASNTIYA